MIPFLYKVLVSLSRYFERDIPIHTMRTRTATQSTPFHGLNVALFFIDLLPYTTLVSGYEKLNGKDLILHKHQQLAKLLFNLIACVIIGIFAFKTQVLLMIIQHKISQINDNYNMNTGSIFFQVAGALGSLATFGAFIFLFMKDKNKQRQIDELAIIARVLTEQNATNEKRLRIAIQPEFKKIGVKENSFPQLKNIGETALITNIQLEPAIGNITAFPFPFYVHHDEELHYDVGGLTIPNSFHLTTLIINYKDKAGNGYTMRVTLTTLKIEEQEKTVL